MKLFVILSFAVVLAVHIVDANKTVPANKTHHHHKGKAAKHGGAVQLLMVQPRFRRAVAVEDLPLNVMDLAFGDVFRAKRAAGSGNGKDGEGNGKKKHKKQDCGDDQACKDKQAKRGEERKAKHAKKFKDA